MKKEVNFVEYPQVGGKYQHYKGGIYEVIAIGRYSEDDSVVVVTKSLIFGSTTVRPLSEWNDIVEKISPVEGPRKMTVTEKVKRFELL